MAGERVAAARRLAATQVAAVTGSRFASSPRSAIRPGARSCGGWRPARASRRPTWRRSSVPLTALRRGSCATCSLMSGQRSRVQGPLVLGAVLRARARRRHPARERVAEHHRADRRRSVQPARTARRPARGHAADHVAAGRVHQPDPRRDLAARLRPEGPPSAPTGC